MRLVMVLSASSTCLVSLLLGLTVADFVYTRRNRTNGPIRFMVLDNLRHQIYLLLLSFVLLNETFGFFHLQRIFLFSIVSGSMVLDAFFSLWRRRKMSELVGDYMGQQGGKRKTDPPYRPPESYHGSIGE